MRQENIERRLQECQLSEIADFVTDKIPMEKVPSLIMLQQTPYFRIKVDDVLHKICPHRNASLLIIRVGMF